MNFSSDDLAKIEGIVALFQDFCRIHLQQLCFGKAEHNQPAQESAGFARCCRNLRASAMVSVRVAEKASRDVLLNCAVLP